jgi:hypothetical protein
VPQRSKIELLGLVESVVEMYFTQGLRQQEIADNLAASGYEISKAAVGRAIKSYAKKLKEIKKTQEWADRLIAATNNTPRLSIADAGLQVAAMKLLEEIVEITDFSKSKPEEKVILFTKVSRAIGLAANVEFNFERGRKQGIIESRKKVEAAVNKLGISSETRSAIMAEFGLGEKNESSKS